MNYLTIAEFIAKYPERERFRVFRVVDGYMFTVKEVNDDHVLLNTHVHLEVPLDSTEYKVHESSLGLDYTLPKVFRYSPDSLDKPVQALNFRKELNTRLHTDKDWAFGRLLRERFYPFGEDLRTVDTDDLIVKVVYDYEFNPITKEVAYRLETITWYNELGEVVHTKPQPKVYVGHEGMKEAQTRRSNIIDAIKHDLDKMSKSGDGSGAAAVGALIAEIDPYINVYIKYGRFDILTVLDASTNPLLAGLVAPDMTALEYMHAKLDFLAVEAVDPDLYKGSLL